MPSHSNLESGEIRRRSDAPRIERARSESKGRGDGVSVVCSDSNARDDEEHRAERDKKGCWESTFYFLIIYFFILTDMYCRIFPMLVLAAYTKKEEYDSWTLSVVFLGVLLLIFA